MRKEALFFGFHEEPDLIEESLLKVPKIELIAVLLELGFDDHLISPDAEDPGGKPPSPARASRITHGEHPSTLR